ncbi:MAG: hypothetical protein ABIW79_02545, partial [Gemmatimonas sp.]
MLTFLLAIQLGVAPPPHSVIRARIDSATREFQQMWRYGWQDAQNAQPSLHSGRSEYDDSHRAVALHCHFLATPLRIRKHAIFGSTRSQGTCPTWYPLDGARIVDERLDLDGALTQRVRPTLQALRMRLRQLLDTAAAQIPGDERIAGQRLRFALDAGDVAGAAIAASECTRDEVQCGLLRGFVLYRAGSTAAADSAFLAAAMV